MIAMKKSCRRTIERSKANADDTRWCRKLGEGRRCQCICRHRRGPAQDAAVVVMTGQTGNAGTLGRRRTKARRHRAPRKARHADGVVMMMQNHDRELHAEGNQHQPHQSETGSRSIHGAPCFSRIKQSAVVMSQSWQLALAWCVRTIPETGPETDTRHRFTPRKAHSIGTAGYRKDL